MKGRNIIDTLERHAFLWAISSGSQMEIINGSPHVSGIKNGLLPSLHLMAPNDKIPVFIEQNEFWLLLAVGAG